MAESDENAGAAAAKSEESSEDQKSSKSGVFGAITGPIRKASEWLREYMVHSLKISAEKPKQLLEEVTFEGVAKYIKSDKCKHIITMAGAGISTSAGIPDFRSPGSGLYDNLAKYDLPNPQAIFDISYFTEHPEPFFTLARELWPGEFKPTPCHYFIKMLDDKGKLLRHYTQNIDTLERVAGLDGDKMVEAHGTFHTSHCLQCSKEFTQEWVKDQIFSGKTPRCDKEECEGIVKPDIVFFGERLPDRFIKCVEEDFQKCDLLIVMGTSLVVQPFASLTARVQVTTPRLYINLEKGQTGVDPFVALLFGGGGGFDFDSEDNYRDVFKESTCDDGCYALADLLGWGDELKKYITARQSKTDKKKSEKGSGSSSKETPKKDKSNSKSSSPSKKHGGKM